MAPTVRFQKMREGAVIPAYQSEGAAGFDFVAPDDVLVPAGATIMVKTGLAVAVPKGYELQIRPRSGMAYKTMLIVKNSPGTVDSDYRGEVGILLHNLGSDNHLIGAGERIAQGVISPVVQATIKEAKNLSETKRGAGGFGSSGK